MKSTIVIFATFLSLMFMSMGYQDQANSNSTPQVEDDCRKEYEEKLIDFEKQNGYKLPNPKYIEYETDNFWFVTRIAQSEELFAKPPSKEGNSVSTLWIRPKTEEAQKEIKEGIYQIALIPSKEIEGATELGMRPSNKGTYLSAAALNAVGLLHIIGHHYVPIGGGPCYTGSRCPDISAKVRQGYQKNANTYCKIYEVRFRCQLYVQAGGYCFWITKTETITPNNSSCTGPYNTVTHWYGPQ